MVSRGTAVGGSIPESGSRPPAARHATSRSIPRSGPGQLSTLVQSEEVPQYEGSFCSSQSLDEHLRLAAALFVQFPSQRRQIERRAFDEAGLRLEVGERLRG